MYHARTRVRCCTAPTGMSTCFRGERSWSCVRKLGRISTHRLAATTAGSCLASYFTVADPPVHVITGITI